MHMLIHSSFCSGVVSAAPDANVLLNAALCLPVTNLLKSVVLNQQVYTMKETTKWLLK